MQATARSSLADGTSVLRADAVLVCAGPRTAALAARGIAVGVCFTDHVRLTYAAGLAALPDLARGLRPPARQHRALGVRAATTAGDRTCSRATASARRGSCRSCSPASIREPVAEVRCVNVHAPWLDEGGDGWFAVRRGRAIAFTGANLMKFGPLLGDRLARTALGDGSTRICS